MTGLARVKRRRLWRGDLASILRGNVGLTVLGLAAGLLMARVLEPEGRGLLAIALVWPAIAVTLLGLPGNQAVAFFAARHPDRHRDVVRVALEMTLVSSGVIVALGVAGSLIVRDQHQLFVALLVAFASTPFMLVTGIGRGLLKVTDLKRWSRQRLIQPGVYTVSILVVAIGGQLTVITGAVVYLVSQVVSACWVWWAVLRATGIQRGPDLGSLRRGTFIYGLKSSVAGSAQITNARLDVAVIGLVVPASQVGLYAVATSLSTFIVPLATAAAPWVFPKLARSAPTMKSWSTAQHAIQLSGALAAAAALGVGVLAPLLLGRVLGTEWLAALVPLWILLGGAVVQAVRQTLISIAAAYNRPGLTAQSEGVAAVVTVTTLWPMVHFFGISGAATVSVIAYAISAVLLYRAVVRTVQKESEAPVDESMSGTT